MGRERIRIAIVGVGNCASSLVQGIAYYAGREAGDAIGLMHCEVGGFRPGDLEVVAAFDVDARKVGLDVSEAIFAPPNCTKVFQADVPKAGVPVRMGCVLDGVSPHMAEYGEARTFVVCDALEADSARSRARAARDGRGGAAQLPAGRLRARHALLHGVRARGGLRGGQLHPRLHRERPGLGEALRRARPADRRRRHQGAARRHDHAPHAHRSVPPTAA